MHRRMIHALHLPAFGLCCIVAYGLEGYIGVCRHACLSMRKSIGTGQIFTFVHPAKGAPPEQFAQFQAAYRGALPLPQELCQTVQRAAVARLVAVACSVTLTWAGVLLPPHAVSGEYLLN